MRFHTRRLLFTSRRVERSSFTARQHVVLYLLFPLPRSSRERAQSGRIPAESTLYIYSEVQHISSIHYSLWAAFPCSFVICFLRQGCSRRTDSASSLLLLSLFFSLSLLFFGFFFYSVFALVAPKFTRYIYICIITRSEQVPKRGVLFIEL